DLTALHAGQTRRRIALPTYPFLRERCWLPDIPTVNMAVSLLGPAEPTLDAEARWTVAVPAAAPVLAQHVVARQRRLRGVASMTRAVAVAHRLGRTGRLRIERLTWRRPLVVDAAGLTACFAMRQTADGVAFELRRD